MSKLRTKARADMGKIIGGQGLSINEAQMERRDRFIERAIKALNDGDFPQFWARVDAVNVYVRRCREDADG